MSYGSGAAAHRIRFRRSGLRGEEELGYGRLGAQQAVLCNVEAGYA